MKSTFGKAFGFVFGLYTACVMINVIDYLLPHDICFFKERTKKSEGSENNSIE